MRVNEKARNLNRTYEGGMAAVRQPPRIELQRAVVNCMLFERTFYESGDDIAKRISELVGVVCKEKGGAEWVAQLAVDTRQRLGLRHVALWVARALAANAQGAVVGRTVEGVIQRADELSEFVAQYWKDGKTPLSAQVKKGLAKAFVKFTPYQLAKYNRDGKVKLRDVLFMCHAKPTGEEQAATWKQLIDGTLAPPDTWEVALSGGADKRTTFERLIGEGKLGALALLRNLRNMEQVKCDRGKVLEALDKANVKGVLPFQFVGAYRAAPSYARGIEGAMLRAGEGREQLEGTTLLLVDVSGSMDDKLSEKGTLNRIDAACALGILLAESCKDVRVFTFSNQVVEVPAARGLGLVDSIHASQPHNGTYLAGAVGALGQHCPSVERLIVVTDEQSHDGQGKAFAKFNYLVNVAAYEPGLEVSGGWHRISGFSERLVEWCRLNEVGDAA